MRQLFFPPPWQVDYHDVLDRVVALPVALTWEEGAQKSRCHPNHSFILVAARHPSTGRGFATEKLQATSILAPPKSLNLSVALYNPCIWIENGIVFGSRLV